MYFFINLALEAVGKVFCANHFVCAGCHVSLVKKNFIQVDDKGYCQQCFGAIPSRVRDQIVSLITQEKKLKVYP